MYAKVAIAPIRNRSRPRGGNVCRCIGPCTCCCGVGQMGSKPLRYCDLPVAGPEILGEIIRDLHCVFEKSYGRTASAEARYRDLEGELQGLRDDLMCCECCKEELENELIKLHPEMKTLQFALEEEIQRRCCVECIANQLRAQLVRADAMLDADCRDKATMQSKIKDLQAELAKLQDMIMKLRGERDDLIRNCKEFERRTYIPPDVLAAHGERCGDLEDALAKCCQMNEALQKQIQNLESANRKLKNDINQMMEERGREEEEFASVKRQAGKEIEYLQNLIRDFRSAIECLTSHNMEICEKFQEVINAHHIEVQGLKSEIERYKGMYEMEAKLRAQCMESHERRFQESSAASYMGRAATPMESPPIIDCTNPCAALIERLQRAPYSVCIESDYKSTMTASSSRNTRRDGVNGEKTDGSTPKPPTVSPVQPKSSNSKMSNKDKWRGGAMESKTGSGRYDRKVYAFHVIQGGDESSKSEESLKRRESLTIRDINGNSGDESGSGFESTTKTLENTVSVEDSLESMPSSEMMLKDKGKEWRKGGEKRGADARATSERIKDLEERLSLSEKRSKFYAELYHRSREKGRSMKVELVLERGKTSKLKEKLEGMKEQLRIAREKIQEFTNKYPE